MTAAAMSKAWLNNPATARFGMETRIIDTFEISQNGNHQLKAIRLKGEITETQEPSTKG